MNTDPTHPSTARDPLSELFDVASALRFLGEALDGLDQAGTPVRTAGAACLASLLAGHVHELACVLWASHPAAQQAESGTLRNGRSPSPGQGQRNQPPLHSEK